LLLEGNDADNAMSEHKKESIRMRARYLAQAYQIALDSMPHKSWHDCCQEAINALAAVHIRNIKNSRVLQRWNEDFETQETMLCLKAKEMGVMIDRTPKCHCELAGEGIEYAWGCAKNHYRRQPLKDKKGKEKFRQTVRKCFSRQVITAERVRMFSQRARAYILAYHKIRQEQLTDSESTTNLDSTASPVNVGKLLKRFKTHRCAMDFDSTFCKAVFHSDNGGNVTGASTSL
jgi:hypothetical protein